MGSQQMKELPEEVKRVRGQLDEWRGQRRHGQRIPEELWGAAVQAVREHGLNRVSRALGLDYYHLKRRSGLSKVKRKAGSESGAVFVELEPMRTEAGVACVVELEKGNGAKLRVCVRDAETVDWCRLKEAFLGA
jgi:NADH:ubiquinone oxidoreductase subunit C